MLLKEKMETGHFSSSEKIVIDYILKEGINIQNKTIKEISETTYTVPSTLIRIAKKVNYKGWNNLKEDFIKECNYLDSHFSNIDANIPFKKMILLCLLLEKLLL